VMVGSAHQQRYGVKAAVDTAPRRGLCKRHLRLLPKRAPSCAAGGACVLPRVSHVPRQANGQRVLG
jgi:hypothetical protein